MDDIPQTAVEKLRAMGTEVQTILAPTRQLFFPLLLAHDSDILSTPRSTFQYGALPRQKVDVYSPPNEHGDPSILVFLYGGGLIKGDRTMPDAPQGIAYANIGYFFSQRGFTTLVADYRTVGEHGGKWPSGGEDVAALVSWMQGHFVPSAGSEASKIFLMGHSAGAIHVGTWLFAPDFEASREASVNDGGAKVNGCTLLCPPAHFRDSQPARRLALEAYYGTDGGIESNCLCSLAKAACGKPPEARDKMRVIAMTAEWDPEDEVSGPAREFVEICQKGLAGCKVQSGYMAGHNHISPIYGLGSGEKEIERWGEDVVGWIRTCEVGDAAA